MRIALRPLLVVTFLAAAACAGSPPQNVARAQEQPFQIRSTTLPLKLDDPAATQVGRLIWRGGVSLTGNSALFGGWSDLHVAPDGRSLKTVSDIGSWLTATIDYDARGHLAGLSAVRIGQLHGLDGKPLTDKRDADAEAMTRLPDGSWLLGFEQRHRLWHYPAGEEELGKGLAGTPALVEGPPQILRQPPNGGLEAMAVLADGRVIMLSEEYSEAAGTTMGWIGETLPGTSEGSGYLWQTFAYATIPDFRVTAIALLPGGSFVTIERAYDMVRGVRVRVMHFTATQLAAGGTVKAEELGRLVTPYAVDNLEGIFATRGPRGETLLWLISDDNLNPLQRTILLLFELAAP